MRCLLLVICTYPFAKKALTLYLARGEGRERYFGCNLTQRKVLASSHQHLMAEAPLSEQRAQALATIAKQTASVSAEVSRADGDESLKARCLTPLENLAKQVGMSRRMLNLG